MVLVNITTAVICFIVNNIYGCYPALVGDKTPIGEFQMVQRLTSQAGYGGDVLQFKETDTEWYGIHRVWLLAPAQKRLERLHSSNPALRRTITGGCINVDPDVYVKLRDCCSTDTLRIMR